jgi:ABC-type bacteriocin/lantibiotic exporter with double-glycine peptidase domain
MGQYANAGSVASEAFSAIRTITALNAQPYFISTYQKFIEDAMQVQ